MAAGWLRKLGVSKGGGRGEVLSIGNHAKTHLAFKFEKHSCPLYALGSRRLEPRSTGQRGCVVGALI